MTLFEAECKKKYLVRNIKTAKDTARRLEALGLTENSPVELIRRARGGASIVKIRGARFALGRKICKEITLWGDSL